MATGHRLSFCFCFGFCLGVFIRGMRQFPLQSPDLEIFAQGSPLPPKRGHELALFLSPVVDIASPVAASKMIVAFHFQPSGRMNYLRFQQLI
ncbi:hypothetical protein ACLKA6_003563 [Drosophila palustris]